MVDCFPSLCEARSSISDTTRVKKIAERTVQKEQDPDTPVSLKT